MFHKKKTTFGRSRKSDINLSSPYSSRNHAYVMCYLNRVYLVDNGSLNGTFVNGKKVSSYCILKSKDTIVFGDVPYDCKEEFKILFKKDQLFYKKKINFENYV